MVRFKNRYTVVELISTIKDLKHQRHFHLPLLKNLIMDTVIKVHGDHGAASITGGFQIKYGSTGSSMLILRTRHGPHRLLVSALPLIQQSSIGNVRFQARYTSGTLRQCYKFLLKNETRNVDRLWARLSVPDRAALQKSFSKEQRT